MNPEGVIIKESKYSVTDTINRLQEFLQRHGATIYARIDQQNELKKTGLTTPPLEFILFGNPKAGGVLMAQNLLIALDLPLKVIAWQDAENRVRVAYNEAKYMENRYGLIPTENSPLNLTPLIEKALV